MPQSCENPSFNKSKPIFARAVCNAMGHALLDPHDALSSSTAWDIFSCEVLDNDSAFERQHGKQSSTFKHEFAYILLFNLQSKHPQLCSADLNPFNDLEYHEIISSTVKALYQTCLLHLESSPDHGFIHHENGEKFRVAPLTKDFCFTSDWCVTCLFDVSYV